MAAALQVEGRSGFAAAQCGFQTWFVRGWVAKGLISWDSNPRAGNSADKMPVLPRWRVCVIKHLLPTMMQNNEEMSQVVKCQLPFAVALK